MPALISIRTAAWLRSAMSRGTGFGSRQRRIVSSGGGAGGGGCELFVARITGGPNDDGSLPCLVSRAAGGPGDVSTEAILLRPDLKRMGTIALNTAVLAHRVSVRYSEGTEADHPEPVAGEED